MFGKNKQGQERTNTLSIEVLQQIATVASETEQPITAEQVGAVLAARDAITAGDPVGTIKKGPEGEIAVRVEDTGMGMDMWRVTCTDGSLYNDLQPTLPWPTIGE